MKNRSIPRYFKLLHQKNDANYLCQFRECGKDYFVTDGGYSELDIAMSFVSLVVRFVSKIAEGKVLDTKAKQVAFTCSTLFRESLVLPHQVQEAPAEYSQLAITGFDLHTTRRANARRKKKVDETLAKLRQLHDELNASLYSKPTERPQVHTPADVVDILQCFLGNIDHEELWVVDLDTRNRVMNLIALYKGSINSSQIRVAEVFRQAIVDNAPAIIVAHNHPSGDPSPSPDDISVTGSIVQAGKILDIDVLDHIIVCELRYVSLKERGLGFS